MPLYSETQRFRQPLLMLLIGIIALLGWGLVLQQIVRDRPLGDDPLPDWGAVLLATLLGIVLPAVFLRLKLETMVFPDRVEIRLRPFAHRVLRPSEIAGAGGRTYRPLREFGGWGIRGWGGNRAYNAGGDQGVQLVLTDGRRVLIGTRRPAELEAAITSILPG